MKQYIKEWRKHIVNAEKSLNEYDFESYKKSMMLAEKKMEQYKRDKELTYDCTNFGMCNHIFEDALPTLLKKNIKRLRRGVD